MDSRLQDDRWRAVRLDTGSFEKKGDVWNGNVGGSQSHCIRGREGEAADLDAGPCCCARLRTAVEVLYDMDAHRLEDTTPTPTHKHALRRLSKHEIVVVN